MVERVLSMHEAQGSIPWFSIFQSNNIICTEIFSSTVADTCFDDTCIPVSAVGICLLRIRFYGCGLLRRLLCGFHFNDSISSMPHSEFYSKFSTSSIPIQRLSFAHNTNWICLDQTYHEDSVFRSSFSVLLTILSIHFNQVSQTLLTSG